MQLQPKLLVNQGLQPEWTYDSQEEAATVVGQAAQGPVVVACGDIYNQNGLRGLDPKDGTVQWSVDKAFFSNLMPTLGPDGAIYDRAFGSNALEVRDSHSGQVTRTLAEDFPIKTSCAVAKDGTVFVGGDQTLYALDAHGAVKWHFPTQAFLVDAAPTLGDDGRVYCTTTQGQVFSLDAHSGKPLWTFQPGSPVGQSVVVGPRGTVYAVDFNDTVYAIDPHQAESTGHAVPEWTAKLDVPVANPYHLTPLNISQPLALSGADVVAVASGQTVRRLTGASGAQQWEETLAVYGPPAVASIGLLTHPDVGGVVLLDPQSGQGMGHWSDGPSSPQAGTVTVINVSPGKLAAFH